MQKPDLAKLKLYLQKPAFARFNTFLLQHKRKLVLVFSAFFCVLFLSAIAGYFFLPGFIKSQAEKAVAEKLHRKLTIQEINFNPLALSLTLKGVKLTERESEVTFVSFDRFYVNLSSWSAVRVAPIIKEIELENPYIHLARTQDNQYNISDIIEMAMKPDEPDKKPLIYSLHNISVDGGTIVFDDMPVKVQHKMEALKIRIPSLTSRPSRVQTFVEPYLSAQINGTKVEMSGKTRPFAKDKETILNLAFAGIDLPRYMGYLPYKPAFQMNKGKLSFDLNLHFSQPENQPSMLEISGKAELDNLQIADANKVPMIAWNKLAVTLGKNGIFANNYQIDKVELSQPDIAVINGADGRLNLASLGGVPQKAAPAKTATKTVEQPEADKKAAETKSAPLKLALKTFVVHGAKLGYTDYATGVPYSVKTSNFELTVDDVMVDMAEKSTRIGKIVSNSARLNVALEKASGKKAPLPKDAAKSESSGSVVSIGSVDISGWSAHLQNNNLKKPMGANLTNLRAHLGDFSTAPGKVSPLKIDAGVDKKGHLSVDGKIGIAPLLVDLALDFKDLNLVVVQQYIDEHVNMTLRQADLSTKGRLHLADGGKGPLQGEYKGDVSVSNFATTDQLRGDPFIRWKEFSLKGMEVKLSPFALNAKEAHLNNFFARLILNADGRMNLQNIMRSEAGGKKSLTDGDGEEGAAKEGTAPEGQAKEAAPKAEQKAEEAKPAAAPVTANYVDPDEIGDDETAKQQVEKEPAKAIPVNIERFQLSNGRVRFTDNFIKPNYTASLSRVHGVITPISGALDASAQIDLKGEVNRAPLTVSGSLNPFNPSQALDVEAHVKGMELAQFSSYTTKYVGYGIEKGQLSFDVTYKVENGELHAENRLILDQLTFGPQAEGKPVMSLPVQFAVNLLKDGDGVIDLNLPISGSLNDPQFSIGGLVFKVIVNLLKNAITSPFKLLASAFGGSEELSWLEFSPGDTAIPAKGDEKLTTLVKALKARPGLKLEITGCYDPVVDKAGLAKMMVQRKARELKKKNMGEAGEKLRPNQIEISDKEYADMLKKVYSDADFKKQRNIIGLQKTLPAAEMERLLAENYPATEEEFMALADRRAAVVKTWLIDKGEIPAERIFIRASKSRTGASSSRVDFSLQ